MIRVYLIFLIVFFVLTSHITKAQSSIQCIDILGGTENGDSDVALDDGDCTTNYQIWHEFVALCWTSGGTPIIDRSLIKFDLFQIPSNATIINANLKLHKHPNPVSANGIPFNGDCSFYVQRVQESWSPNTTNWCNQPTSAISDQILVPCQSFINLDSLNIDVTSMIDSMLLSPQNNNGFMIKMKTESPYCSATFASQNFSDQNLHPKLNICYSTITSIKDEQNKFKNNFSISQNNNNSQIDIVFKTNTNCKITLYSINASKIFESTNNSSFNIDLPLSNGFYVCTIKDLEMGSEANYKLVIK